MMGQMMGGGSGGGPLLIISVILLAVLVVAALTVTVTLRSGRLPGLRVLGSPGRRQGDSRPAARAEPGEDPLVILRERYVRGEISHAEFLDVLDQVLPGGQGRMPSGPEPGSLAGPA